jgi:hypothetical protein
MGTQNTLNITMWYHRVVKEVVTPRVIPTTRRENREN